MLMVRKLSILGGVLEVTSNEVMGVDREGGVVWLFIGVD